MRTPPHKKDDILCITMSTWEGPKRVRHNLMREYARRGHKVLFVEAALSWVKLLRGFRFWKQAILVFRGVRTTEDGVHVVMMPPLIPGGEWVWFISKANWLLVGFWLNRFVIPKLGLSSPRLFVFSPQAGFLVGTFGESVSVYFCNDPFTQMFAYASARPNIRRMEDELTKKVDIVFTVSEKLLEERKKINMNSHLIPLAANIDIFSRALEDSCQTPQDIQTISHPVISYVGVINNRVDVDLVREVAVHMKDCSFVFVGPVLEMSSAERAGIDMLKEIPNIHFLGDKSEEMLPGYLKSSDVCMIPYVRSTVTQYIKANAKFFQYVAAGKPVVSTIGPHDFDKEIVLNAVSSAEFSRAVRRALTLTTRKHQQSRLRLARRNSWAVRVNLIERLLAKEQKAR